MPRLLAGFLVVGGTGRACALTTDISDSAISNVITAVANHWQHALADGSYPAATTLSEAQAAAKPAGITWEYAWGVNLYGQLHVTDATGNQTFENFVSNHNLICGRYYTWLAGLTNTLTDTSGLAKFQRTNAALGTFFILNRLDYCGAMTAQLLEGARRQTGGLSPGELQIAKVTADYIAHRQSRLPDGTLWRSTVYGGTIWGDDLYMSCPFLVRWSQYTGDAGFLDDTAQQVIHFAGYLQDTNGLWFHGYYNKNHSVNGIKWGRANGWAMVATTEVLSALPANHPARADLLSILRRHIAGVEAVQAPDGLWHQVLDRPEVWEETSCTAMFAYSIARAVNRGWIDATNLAVARKAFAAIAQMEVSPAGAISNICPGTSLNTNLAYYTNQISLRPSTDDRHGPGPVMLAGAELLLSSRPDTHRKPE
ncbi:MAG: glycoside hydrolase family 105 protein [Limisphaerales bacterium]